MFDITTYDVDGFRLNKLKIKLDIYIYKQIRILETYSDYVLLTEKPTTSIILIILFRLIQMFSCHK